MIKNIKSIYKEILLPKTRGVVTLELLAAFIVMLFCLHLFFAFSKQQIKFLKQAGDLRHIGIAQLFLIQKKDVIIKAIEFKTQHRTCKANWIQNTQDLGVVYHYYEILDCQ